ncbi:MAG TPA: CoA ester lyase [Sporichthyaceae bacterium]|nr:CoA ester lyase [Sporichthyaceae bacterium]
MSGPKLRARRSCLAVPGSSPKMLAKAQGLPADQVFLDLEDAVAPLAKPDARKNIVAALNEGDWGGKTRVVRVNDLTTSWTYRDTIEVVEGAGELLDCIMLPKVQTADQIVWLDLLLTQIEKTMGFEVGRIGIEAQIENARGLVNVDAIAAASPRLETVIFGPADFMASINMKSLVVGEQPPGYDVGDAYHYILMRILMAARTNNLQAIDGPYCRSRTSTATAAWPAAPRRWATTANGSCTPARSTPPTRCSRRRRRTTTTPSSSWTPTTTTARRKAACGARSCSATR